MNIKLVCTSSLRDAVCFGIVAISIYFPTSAVAQRSTLVAPEFNVPAMKQAWDRAPVSCRKAVKEVLTSYSFYDGPIDGSWNEATLAGIKHYTAGGQNLDFNSVSYLGSLGLIYHMGHPEKSCFFPEIE